MCVEIYCLKDSVFKLNPLGNFKFFLIKYNNNYYYIGESDSTHFIILIEYETRLDLFDKELVLSLFNELKNKGLVFRDIYINGDYRFILFGRDKHYSVYDFSHESLKRFIFEKDSYIYKENIFKRYTRYQVINIINDNNNVKLMLENKDKFTENPTKHSNYRLDYLAKVINV